MKIKIGNLKKLIRESFEEYDEYKEYPQHKRDFDKLKSINQLTNLKYLHIDLG